MSHLYVGSAARVAPPQQEPARPRVFRYRRKIGGCSAWYALDRDGRLVAPGLRIVWPGEHESDIVVELLDALAEHERKRLRVITTPPRRQPRLSSAAFVRLLTHGVRQRSAPALPRPG